MRSKIKRCRTCDLYTLKENCPICGAPAGQTKPARFSPEDRYGRFRRAMRQEAP